MIKYKSITNKSLLLLTLNTFDSVGGVQNVCKTLCYTLKCISKQKTQSFGFKVLSLHDEAPNERYIPKCLFFGFRGNKSLFFLKAITCGIKTNTIIISHIHLLFIAKCIKVFHKEAEIIMLAHGTEVLRKIQPWKKAFLKKHVKIWAVSDFTRQKLENIHNIHPENITVTHNCLDPFFEIPTRFDRPQRLLKKYNLSGDQPLIISITRITKHDRNKGYELIINLIPKLLKEFPALRYLICGKADPDEKQRLQQLINQKDLQEHIYITDFIPEDELSEHYMLADVFILPSRKEGFGLVFIEAAACGCRIISGNADGSIDAMLNGRLGTMIDPENSLEIQQALTMALRKGRNPGTALNIQKNCIKHFSHKKYQQKIIKLLKQTRV